MAELTRDHVLDALQELDAGHDHPFGEPTRYELVYQGRLYPPKGGCLGDSASWIHGGYTGVDGEMFAISGR